MNDKIKVKYDGRYLLAYMPNCDVIPMQTELTIENKVGDKDVAYVTIQCVADISDLKEADKNEKQLTESYDYLQGKNTELKEKLKFSGEGVAYWQDMYDKELNKPWYKKLFGL